MNCVPDVKWILECGCEPMIEHCEQCDTRREVREYALARQLLYNSEKEARELRAKLSLPPLVKDNP